MILQHVTFMVSSTNKGLFSFFFYRSWRCSSRCVTRTCQVHIEEKRNASRLHSLLRFWQSLITHIMLPHTLTHRKRHKQAQMAYNVLITSEKVGPAWIGARVEERFVTNNTKKRHYDVAFGGCNAKVLVGLPLVRPDTQPPVRHHTPGFARPGTQDNDFSRVVTYPIFGPNGVVEFRTRFR